VRHFVFPILLLLLLVVAPACQEAPDYAGTGGALDNPTGVAIKWPYAYITNANFDLSDDKVGWIAVLDLETALIRRDTALLEDRATEPFLAKAVIDDAGEILYVADRRTNQIRLFDLIERPERPLEIDLDPGETGKQGIEVGRQPYGMAITPDGKLMFVACMESGDVSIVDLERRILTRNVQLSSGVNDVKFDPSGKYAYVTNKQFNQIVVLDAANGNFVTGFGAFGGLSLTGFDFRGLDFTPNGDFLFIAARAPSAVLMIDTAKLPLQPTEAVLRVLPAETSPMDVAVRPDGAEVWATNFDSNSVIAFDAVTGEQLGAMDSGQSPVHLAFFDRPDDPGYYYLLVTNFNGHNVTLFDAMTKEPIWSIP
jgi:DNA-binding beta-propeller fold protein YncE